MSLGNWRHVVLSGPYAVKVPRPERVDEARCLNRWEYELWTVWRERFGWPHLCPVVWADLEGYVLVMQRASQDATRAEIVAFETAWMDSQRLPLPSGEDKPEDWGHLHGRLVLCDYGYGCWTEDAIERERRDLAAALQRWGPAQHS